MKLRIIQDIERRQQINLDSFLSPMVVIIYSNIVCDDYLGSGANTNATMPPLCRPHAFFFEDFHKSQK